MNLHYFAHCLSLCPPSEPSDGDSRPARPRRHGNPIIRACSCDLLDLLHPGKHQSAPHARSPSRVQAAPTRTIRNHGERPGRGVVDIERCFGRSSCAGNDREDQQLASRMIRIVVSLFVGKDQHQRRSSVESRLLLHLLREVGSASHRSGPGTLEHSGRGEHQPGRRMPSAGDG